MTSEKCEAAFDAADLEDMTFMFTLVQTLNINGLIYKINSLLAKARKLESLSYAALRELAKNESVYKYSRLSKLELIKELKRVMAKTGKSA